VRPEDGQARPKHVVTFDNKVQNQDSCEFRQIPPPSFDIKIDIQEVAWGGMDWIDLAQDRDR
jgi:hypothetical protein